MESILFLFHIQFFFFIFIYWVFFLSFLLQALDCKWSLHVFTRFQHTERICNTAYHLTHRSHSETEAWQCNTLRGRSTLPFSSGGFLSPQKSEFSTKKWPHTRADNAPYVVVYIISPYLRLTANSLRLRAKNNTCTGRGCSVLLDYWNHTKNRPSGSTF